MYFWIIYRLSAPRVRAAGKTAHESSNAAIHRASQMFDLAREVLLRGEGGFLIRRVREALASYYHADEVSRVSQLVPKYAIEMAAVTALLASPIIHSYLGHDVRSAVAVPCNEVRLCRLSHAAGDSADLQQHRPVLHYFEPAARGLADALDVADDSPVSRSKLHRMPERALPSFGRSITLILTPPNRRCRRCHSVLRAANALLWSVHRVPARARWSISCWGC